MTPKKRGSHCNDLLAPLLDITDIRIRMEDNGWKKEETGETEPYAYSRVHLAKCYNVMVTVHIAEKKEHLEYSGGHYGVAWIDVKHENDGPYILQEIEDMIEGIEMAENKLIKIGIPFSLRYRFRFADSTKKTLQNFTLRKRYGLDEKEK